MFLIYINDLPKISNILQFYLFADDTNIYLESDNLEELEHTMNKELKKLHDWLCINRLSLNISKTNFVIFCPINKPKKSVTILINKKSISETKYVKYLGILIDSQLSFKSHIYELNKKISRSIGVLYKIRPFVSSKILTNLYYAIVYPFLLYGVLIWGNANKTLLSPTLILQKKFVRMATYNDRYPVTPGPLAHTPPLFHKLNILTIFDIFKLQLALLVFESTNEIGPTSNIIRYTRANELHPHETRYANTNNFYVNYSRTTRYGLRKLQTEGTKLWVTIPHHIKDRPSKISFKKSYKKYLIGLHS